MSKFFRKLWHSSLICRILKFILVVDNEDFSENPLSKIDFDEISPGERANLLLEQMKVVISTHQAISASLITIISLYFAGYLWAISSLKASVMSFGVICLEAAITSVVCGIIFYLDFKTKKWCKSAATALHYSPFHGNFSEIGLFLIGILLTLIGSVVLAWYAVFKNPELLKVIPTSQ